MANNELDFAMLSALVKALGGSADPAVIESAVSDWLDQHPEATTTVEDGSITKAKLDSNLAGAIDDVSELKTAIDDKLDKSVVDPNGISIDTSGFVVGGWTEVNVGDTVTAAAYNTIRRKIFDLSNYIGWTVSVKIITSLNPQTKLGEPSYLCDNTGVVAIKLRESVDIKNGYTYTVTPQTAYMYVSYTNANFTSISVTAISNIVQQLAKIDTLEAEMATTVKPLQFPNLCKNANIDDLTGFSVNSVATISADDNVLTITPTARNSETDYTVPVALEEGHRYYMAVGINSNYTGNSLFVRARVLKSGTATQTIGDISYNGLAPDTWQRLSFITSEAPDFTSLRMNIFCSSTGLEVIYARQIVILDLTEIFGAGNEPDVGTVDMILAEHTDGTAFFEGTLDTDVITNSTYPDPGAEKPIFVGISGYVMNVNAKYSATQDIRYKVGKAGSNELFNWRGFDFIDNSTGIVSPKVDLTQSIAVITDWFGPHKLKVSANADGDMPDSDNFTGGNHAYSGDSTGTPTARTASYAFYVDGRKVTSFLGYAYYVDVYWQNYVQATNTKKADGTGREVLKETFHMHFDGEKWTLDGMLEPLEALASWSYYGIQMSRGSAYNGYIFYHDCPSNRTWHSTKSSSEAGAKVCKTITMHDGPDYFEMHIGADGLGDFALLGDSYSSFFSSDSKTYSNLVKGATSIAANSVFTYNGYYKWYNEDLAVT